MRSPGECRGTISQPQPPPAKLEYGTHAHVTSAVNSPEDAKKAFLIRHWKTCKNDKEVVTWIDSVSLSKHNKAKSITWMSRIQQWHSDLTAAGRTGQSCPHYGRMGIKVEGPPFTS